jgi:hypothetical protein
MMFGVAAAFFAAGLWCLRGWWLPPSNSGAVVEHRRPAVRPHQAEVLRFRIEAVVRADRAMPGAVARAGRGYPYGYQAEPRAKAAA